MADEVYFSEDEEWDQAMVQAVEQTVEDYFSGDEVSEQAMVQRLDQTEREAAWEKESKRKKSIIPIKNRDDLCCARAIVTMRAWCHRNDPVHFDSSAHPWRDWCNCRDGFSCQGVLARELHQAAGVAEGPCGLPELTKFQQYLSTLDPPYQLKVLSRQHPFFLIFRGPDAPHLIMLLKSDDHYDGCTTFSGFFAKKKRYWCHQCDKVIGNNRTHACQRQP